MQTLNVLSVNLVIVSDYSCSSQNSGRRIEKRQAEQQQLWRCPNRLLYTGSSTKENEDQGSGLPKSLWLWRRLQVHAPGKGPGL